MNQNMMITSTAVHSYHPAVAAEVGINAAVLFYNICFWVAQNAANERNCVNGKYWTYNSVSAYSRLFPEFTEKQIRTALQKLQDSGYIESGCFNEDPMDKTKWYTVTSKANAFVPIGQMEQPTKSNDNNIYNINNNTDNKHVADNDTTDNSHNKYAFSPKEEKDGDIYASFPKETEVDATPKENRYIPEDYTEEQLRNHIKPVIHDYIAVVYSDWYSYDLDKCAKTVVNIIVEFYREYEKRFHVKHRILSDKAYQNIADRYMSPPEIMNECSANDLGAYSAMMEQYFNTEYNKRGYYDGDITLSISHFMSDEIRSNLFYRTCY